jgi:hypothetical protein
MLLFHMISSFPCAVAGTVEETTLPATAQGKELIMWKSNINNRSNQKKKILGTLITLDGEEVSSGTHALYNQN